MLNDGYFKFDNGSYTVKGWDEHDGEKCVVVHQDQNSSLFSGSSVRVLWFTRGDFRPVKANYYERKPEGYPEEYGSLIVAWEIKYKEESYNNILLPQSWKSDYYRAGRVLSSRTSEVVEYQMNKKIKDEDFQIVLQKPIQIREYISSNHMPIVTLNPDGSIDRGDNINETMVHAPSINYSIFILLITLMVLIVVGGLGYLFKKKC